MTPPAVQSYVSKDANNYGDSVSSSHFIAHEEQHNTKQEYDKKILIQISNRSADLSKLITSENNVYNLIDFTQLVHHQESPKLAMPDSVTISDMVQKIRGIFGLNNVQVASVVKVSRPSLYNHISEKESPKSLESYHSIYDLALRVEEEVQYDIRPGLKSILVDGRTLLSHLKTAPINSDKIFQIALQIACKLKEKPIKKLKISSSDQRSVSHLVTKSG